VSTDTSEKIISCIKIFFSKFVTSESANISIIIRVTLERDPQSVKNLTCKEMLSKNKAKFIVSLQKKKERDEEGLYLIEGDKLVREFLAAKISFHSLVAKPEFLNSLPKDLLGYAGDITEVSFEELRQISTLKTPHNALAVVAIPKTIMDIDEICDSLNAALDFVQDPGNLGTIIRAAAWFGVKNIICSENCVDVYNPKVIQSTMGAILHVNVFYCNLKEFFEKVSERNIQLFGTLLEGTSIYENKLGNKGIILLGNESKGISDELKPFITDRIRIPGANTTTPGIESLNVGMAASVVFSEFMRRRINKGDL
jgi:RNA methyltransferase, TrmH family